MADKQYLDYGGLGKYNTKIQAQIGDKVEKEAGKGLSTNDFTTTEKEKLEGLKNYTLPVTSDEAIGGVKLEVTENPVPTSTALKAGADGTAFVDWSQAPKASASDPGLIKLGATLKVNEDGSVDVDETHVGTHEVAWSDITGKPDVAIKSDLTNVYTYKGSVATYEGLPTEGMTAGDVYNVETTGMNYAWTGTTWDDLGGTFEVSSITDEQIDALFADET